MNQALDKAKKVIRIVVLSILLIALMGAVCGWSIPIERSVLPQLGIGGRAGSCAHGV